jgi:asparagine synthetase B (glutamine-hydrolysing)
MSAQAGVWFFDDRPVDSRLIATIDQSLARLWPDNCNRYVVPGFAIVHRGKRLTPDIPSECQDKSTAKDRAMAWFVGRLDNRNDLLMRMWRDVGIDKSDAALVAGLYERLGVDAFPHLLGDWNVVIRDVERGRLVFSSDHFGTRPLYLRRTSTYVSWSTDLSELIVREGQYDHIETTYVRDYVARRPQTGTPIVILNSFRLATT